MTVPRGHRLEAHTSGGDLVMVWPTNEHDGRYLSAEFVVFDQPGIDIMTGEPLWRGEHDFAPDRSAAVPCLSGYVKWDACMNFTQRETTGHFCGLEALEGEYQMFRLVYELAREVMGDAAERSGCWPPRGHDA